ncbi:MAG: MFS transporter [Clostridia bacterium]|nr:MFS transporter [Clostridia bacterium]
MTNDRHNPAAVRWIYLIIGVIAMLFAGILYAWSILKAPFAAEFGWSTSNLALNFTLAMSFFCIGGLLGARIARRAGHRAALIAAGALAMLGFMLTAILPGTSVLKLYAAYGVMAGLGIGIAYNVVVSTVSAWFPDKKGFCSGCLMMGFGASALVLGNAANAMFRSSLGWRTTYIILGASIGLILLITALLLKKPGANTALPQGKASNAAAQECFERSDYTSAQMLRRPSFWMAFTFLTCLAATGSTVISFAKDLAMSVHAPEALAVTLVGVLSVCNGLGRILTGALFDAIGRRTTMLCANVLTICAAGITLLSVSIASLPLCMAGLCLTGLSYGACPTITAAFTSAFYGMKHFSANMAFMTFTSMSASLIATVSSRLLESSGGYTTPFLLLLGLSVFAFFINLFIRKP